MSIVSHNPLDPLTSARYTHHMYQGPCHNHPH